MSRARQQGSGSGSSSVDYEAVDLPSPAEKPRVEWHYTERRAELLQLVREAGHPDDLNQTELAERYGVSQQQISKDMKRLGEAIREGLDADRRALRVDSVVQRSIRALLDKGEHRKAAKTAMEWDEWVASSDLPTGNGPAGDDRTLAEVLSAEAPTADFSDTTT